MNQTIKDHQQYLLKTYPFRGLDIVAGQGNYLIDSRGKQYLDLVTGFGVNIFGHAHPVLTKALTDQLATLSNLHGSFANAQRSRAARRLVEKLGGKYAVYFGNSGTEAVEAAIKFAWLITGRSQFVSCDGAFHGKSLGALSLNGQSKHTADFHQLLFKAAFLDYTLPREALPNTIGKQTAAVIVEPIQGEAGVRLPRAGYLESLARSCETKQALFIIDEIQTGLGRTGNFFAFESLGISPDIITLGKGLGGGIPLGATLVHKKHAAKIKKGAHTSTTGGNPLACAGLNATLGLLTDRVLANNKNLGDYFLKKLGIELSNRSRVSDVRGRGLLLGVELSTEITPVLKALQDQGVLAAPAGDKVVRFLPPYTITKSEIDQTVELLSKIIASSL